MFSRKPQTILTSKKLNAMKTKAKKSVIMKETEMTSPAELYTDMVYVSIGGVTMPISK